MYSTFGSGTGGTVGQVGAILRPRISRTRNPVVYMHSASSDATESVGAALPSVNSVVLRRIADLGFTIAANTQPAASVGNDTAQSRITDAIAAARAAGAHASAPAVLCGTSMGSSAVLRFAAQNPSLVACVVTWLTIPDLLTAYDDDVNGWRDLIATAYGFTEGDPLPAGIDYARGALATALTGVPILAHHSSDDAWWTTSSGGATFLANTGATEADVGALGHTDGSIAATSLPAIADFIEANTP